MRYQELLYPLLPNYGINRRGVLFTITNLQEQEYFLQSQTYRSKSTFYVYKRRYRIRSTFYKPSDRSSQQEYFPRSELQQQLTRVFFTTAAPCRSSTGVFSTIITAGVVHRSIFYNFNCRSSLQEYFLQLQLQEQLTGVFSTTKAKGVAYRSIFYNYSYRSSLQEYFLQLQIQEQLTGVFSTTTATGVAYLSLIHI